MRLVFAFAELTIITGLLASCCGVAPEAEAPDRVFLPVPAFISESVTVFRSGTYKCGAWLSGPAELTTALHCYNGEDANAERVAIRSVRRMDILRDTVVFDLANTNPTWLDPGKPYDNEIVDVVSPIFGVSITPVTAVSSNFVNLEWTAKPGWSGSPAIGPDGTVACMISAYYYAGGTKCVKVK